MEAKELMIGNYVNISNFVTKKSTQIQIDYDDFVHIVHQNHLIYKSIPLTEDWLLRFGYKLDEWRFSIIKPDNYDGFLLCDGNTVITDKLKYVHQLQNLYFCLVGEELILK